MKSVVTDLADGLARVKAVKSTDERGAYAVFSPGRSLPVKKIEMVHQKPKKMHPLGHRRKLLVKRTFECL